MSITPEFLRRVQDAGWNIVGVDQVSLWIGCPWAGCGLKTRHKAGSAIPTACRSELPIAEIVLEDYVRQARPALRDRRQQLGLSIKELEYVSGIAGDHLAKMEKNDPSKIPNILTFTDWARTLGFKILLVPDAMPQVMLTQIAETRAAQDRRRAVSRHFGRVRKGREVAALPKP